MSRSPGEVVPRSVQAPFERLYSGLSSGSLEHVLRTGGSSPRLRHRLKRFARHSLAISHPTIYFGVSFGTILGAQLGLLEPLGIIGWSVMGPLTIVGLLGLAMAVSYFRTHYRESDIETLFDDFRVDHRRLGHHADEIFQCLARLAPFVSAGAPTTLTVHDEGFEIAVRWRGREAVLQREGGGLRVVLGGRERSVSVSKGSLQALSEDLADALHGLFSITREVGPLHGLLTSTPALRLQPSPMGPDDLEVSYDAAFSAAFHAAGGTRAGLEPMRRPATSRLFELAVYGGILTACVGGLTAMWSSNEHAVVWLGLGLSVLSLITFLPSLIITLPPLPRTTTTRRPLEVENRVPQAFVLDATTLRLDTHPTGIDLSAPFSTTLTRDPEITDDGRTLVTVELAQGDARAHAKLSFSVVARADESVVALPSYISSARLLDPLAFEQQVWPALRAAAFANGESLELKAEAEPVEV